MKIVIIHGQSHQGSTCHTARQLAEKLKGETKEFFLPRDFDDICTGCTACFKKDEKLCPHHEKLKPLTEAVDEAVEDDTSDAASQDTPPVTQQMVNNNPTFFNINISGGNNSFYQHVDKLTINNGGKQDE